jgi:hypothetical protein
LVGAFVAAAFGVGVAFFVGTFVGVASGVGVGVGAGVGVGFSFSTVSVMLVSLTFFVLEPLVSETSFPEPLVTTE